MISPQERRQHPRLERSVPLKIKSDDFDVVTETVNLSRSGAYCQVNKELKLMTKLQVHLLLPIKKNHKVTTKKISCEGVIVRSEESREEDCFNVAIFFNEIKQNDLSSLSEYIHSMLDESK